MMKVLIEVPAGSCDKHVYNEETLEVLRIIRTLQPYPYPYGFILGTVTDDGEALDCYVLTSQDLEAGTSVECEAVGLLEFFEEDETDHKILAVLPGEKAALEDDLQKELSDFIYAIFKKFPDMKVRVGDIRPKVDALDHIARHRT